jgi:iron complex transport system substrate-binding protein
MPGFASLWAASAAALKVASLNLCTDEYLLLLARPGEIASVTHLSRDPRESVLWRAARRHGANAGSLESALQPRPTLLLTMGGGGGRSTALLARRLGIRVLDLPYPASIADVERQAVRVAAALGNPRRAAPLLHQVADLRRNAPGKARDAAFVGGGGLSLDPAALGAQWMRLAGLQQRALPGGRLDLETLATRPPQLLLRSDYRGGQWSRDAAWLRHPLVWRLQGRTVPLDGRAWTCAGLPMIAEVRRLRKRFK